VFSHFFSSDVPLVHILTKNKSNRVLEKKEALFWAPTSSFFRLRLRTAVQESATLEINCDCEKEV